MAKLQIYEGYLGDSIDEMKLSKELDLSTVRFIEKQWDVLWIYCRGTETYAFNSPMVTTKIV